MTYTYLQDRQHYEDRYDESTVEVCRHGERVVNQTFTEMQKKLPAYELKQQKPGWYLEYSTYYFALVEMAAAERAAKREQTIAKWMQEDEAKDQKLADAHLTSSTYCRSCGKDMRVMDKHYMRRDGRKEDDILIMFTCDSCNKRNAFWQDGTEWEGAKIKCGQCGGDVESTHKEKGKVITTTMTCTKCKHVETDIIDMSKERVVEEEPIDPYYELDRKRFILDDDMLYKFQQKAQHLGRLQKLNAAATDRTEHADVYDAVKDIKKLKIAQLSAALAVPLQKQQYSEFKLGEPELGREVSVAFNCLDAKDDREEYDSKKGLQKLIDKTLIDTNWRLMSEGVHYRLGYLTGRLKAYEKEEDLKKLVEQRIKKGTLPPPKLQPVKSLVHPMPEYEGLQMRDAVITYMDKLTLGSIPAEITLKSGKKKPHNITIIHAVLHPLLRVFIPMRENDDSVPEFIRTYDFQMGPSDEEIPKVTKDKLGREIRRL